MCCESGLCSCFPEKRFSLRKAVGDRHIYRAARPGASKRALQPYTRAFLGERFHPPCARTRRILVCENHPWFPRKATPFPLAVHVPAVGCPRSERIQSCNKREHLSISGLTLAPRGRPADSVFLCSAGPAGRQVALGRVDCGALALRELHNTVVRSPKRLQWGRL